MVKSIITAIRTLSILPVPGEEASDFASSLPWFPLVGGLLGAIIYGMARVGCFATGGAWPEGIALLVVIGGIVTTRGLHLDGLADWADGFMSVSDKGKTLEIMKDSHVGVFGTIALIVVLMTKWTVITNLAAHDGLLWIIAAYIASRTVQVELAVCLPYARLESGTGAPFITGARVVHRLRAWALAFLFIVSCCGFAGIWALVVGWLTCRLFGLWCVHRIGGVTGDTLGACSEITETVVLFSYSVMGAGVADVHKWGILLS